MWIYYSRNCCRWRDSDIFYLTSKKDQILIELWGMQQNSFLQVHDVRNWKLGLTISSGTRIRLIDTRYANMDMRCLDIKTCHVLLPFIKFGINTSPHFVCHAMCIHSFDMVGIFFLSLFFSSSIPHIPVYICPIFVPVVCVICIKGCIILVISKNCKSASKTVTIG